MSGTCHLSPQYKYCRANLSASMETPDIEGHCPHALSLGDICQHLSLKMANAPLAPVLGKFIPSSPHHGWSFGQLPQFLDQRSVCLLEFTVQGWRKGPHQPQDHVALQKVSAEGRETGHIHPGLWGCLENSLPLCSHLDTPGGRPFSSVSIENKGLTLE